MINRQQLLDRGFTKYTIWTNEFNKSRLDDNRNMFSINVKFNGELDIEDINFDCYILESSEGYSSEIKLPVNTIIEDIDHLIRILNL